MSGVKKQSQTGVGLIQKTFQVLDLFQLEKPALSQAEIIIKTGMSRSTASRLVRYLVDTGYLVQDSSSGYYRLGASAADLGRRAMAGFDLKAICQPALERLSKLTDETIILTSLDRSMNTVVCVDQIESNRGGLRVFEKIGATFPLHAGAAPRAILAHLPETIRDDYLNSDLEQFTPYTMVDKEKLRKDIKRIKKVGYAVSVEETYEGAAGISSAFVDQNNYPLGSIAIAFPLKRLTKSEQEKIGRQISEIADSVSLALKHHG
ncbi:MAG: IclR family transcriptional regulator [Halopseudomonas aestusnigri]